MRRIRGIPFLSSVSVVAAAALVASAIPVAAQPAGDPHTESAAPGEPAEVNAPVPEVNWGECEGENVQRFDCATVQVPSDYDQPHGATTSIAMTRLPATEPERKIGSLFLNFGGPGGPGVANLHALGGTLFTDEVRARFDIVAFDPRGVGLSDPVTCFANQQSETEFLSGMDAFPVGTREELQAMTQYALLGLSCTAVSGDRIATSSTANVARDMDLLRQAVGDEKLNYVGYSYGTFLGATYGKLFPERIRTMVLDGTIDPEAYVGKGDDRSLGRRLGQHVAAAETYQQFLQLCEEAGPQGCALAGLGEAEQVVEDLFDKLAENPVELKGPDGSTVEFGYDEAVVTIFQAMYSPMQWSNLAAMLATLAAPAQGARALTAQGGPDSIRDFLREIGFFSEYASIGGSLASMCVDAEHPGTLADYPAQADAAEEEAEHFGAARAWVGSQCETVSVDDEDAYTGPWQQTTQAPVLVIGTRYDPATPYKFTEPYTDLWPNGNMLTIEGYGHTTAMTPSSCADAAIEHYLIDREATDGATCQQDVAPFTQAAQQVEPKTIPAALG